MNKFLFFAGVVFLAQTAQAEAAIENHKTTLQCVETQYPEMKFKIETFHSSYFFPKIIVPQKPTRRVVTFQDEKNTAVLTVAWPEVPKNISYQKFKKLKNLDDITKTADGGEHFIFDPVKIKGTEYTMTAMKLKIPIPIKSRVPTESGYVLTHFVLHLSMPSPILRTGTFHAGGYIGYVFEPGGENVRSDEMGLVNFKCRESDEYL